MNAAATAFAHPPERRRCGRSVNARRSARARNTSERTPKRHPANPDHQPPPTRIWIEFAFAPSFASRSRRDPDRSPNGGIA
jgi:hypothetical protein